jgi:hypothetical protein
LLVTERAAERVGGSDRITCARIAVIEPNRVKRMSCAPEEWMRVGPVIGNHPNADATQPEVTLCCVRRNFSHLSK